MHVCSLPVEEVEVIIIAMDILRMEETLGELRGWMEVIVIMEVIEDKVVELMVEVQAVAIRIVDIVVVLDKVVIVILHIIQQATEMVELVEEAGTVVVLQLVPLLIITLVAAVVALHIATMCHMRVIIPVVVCLMQMII